MTGATITETLAHSHRSTALVEVLRDDVKVAELDTVLDGSVTLDGMAEIRARLDLTIVDDGTLGLIPTNEGDLLVPYGNELRVSRSVNGTDVQLGVFKLERAAVSDTGAEIAIAVGAPDRAARFIDAPFENPYTVPSGTLAGVAILDVVQQAWAEVPTDFMPVSVPLPLLSAEEGESRWDFVQGIAQAIGAELYFNRSGVLVLTPAPGGGSPVAAFAEGAGGVLLGVEREWDRAPVFNRVIVIGENPDPDADTDPRGVATDEDRGSPTDYFGRFGKKPFTWSNSFILTNEQAQAAADALLLQLTGAPDVISFATIVDPARDPGEVVRIKRDRLGIDEDHVIDTLTIPLGVEGEMQGKTRVLQTVQL